MGQLFRDVHTLKGSGASVELAFFAEFTHDVENLMDKLRSHKIEYKPEMAETLIDGLDVMKEILELEVSNQINREKFQDLTTSLLEELRAYSNASITTKTVELKQEPAPQNVTVLEKTNNQISDQKEHFGFFNDDLNNQRDMKDMPFGIFEDDDIDDKNIGFYDEELENISNNTDDNKFKIDENKENFGFFDGMEKISPNSVMETNDIESEISNDNKIDTQNRKK